MPDATMTILELTRLMTAQDDAWARTLEHAQIARHPSAPIGVAFFQKTWRPALSDYFERIAARYNSSARTPATVLRAVLDKMSNEIYPAARQAGLTDRSFVVPDIQL